MSTAAKRDGGSSGLSSLGPTRTQESLPITALEPTGSAARSALVADKTITLRTVRGPTVTVPYDVTREEARLAIRATNSAETDLVLGRSTR